MTSDLDLLGRYAQEKSQDAFTMLVNRHVNLVYSAALRQVRSPQLAEEIAQSGFADLARVAATPSSPFQNSSSQTSLTPWLYAVTRRRAIDVIRKESRRQLREQIAVELNDMNATSGSGTGVPPVWTDIEQYLDDAMATLDETDRTAILLRYFENKNLREVGEALGTSDDTAQKRVSRAVERLREFFSKRNVTIGTSALAVLISANAVQSAPIGLALTISTAVVLTGTVVSTSTAIAVTKTIAMTILQKTLVTAALTAAVGAGIFEAHQATELREQNQKLQQQQTILVDQFRQLKGNNEALSNSFVSAVDSKKLSDEQFNELLKLRGKVAVLQNNANDSFMQLSLALKAKKEKLLQLFAERPEYYVPEIHSLNDKDWLNIIRQADKNSTNWFGQTLAGKSDAEIKQSEIGLALSDVIYEARKKFAPIIQQALKSFMDSHDQQRLNTISELKPYFESPVDDVVLKQYKLLSPGIMEPIHDDKDLTDTDVITGKEEVLFANPLVISPYDYFDVLAAEVAKINGIVEPMTSAFAAANNNASPSSFSEIKPYITTSEQQKAYDDYNKLLKRIQINFPWFHYPFAP